MNTIKLRNECTRELVEIPYSQMVKTIKIKLENALANFMRFNYKSFNWGCTSSYFYDYEFIENEIEVSIGNITVYYDVTKLTSNVCNNACDGVIISLKDENINTSYSRVVNSQIFKYFELSMYNQITNLFDKMARGCHEYELNMDEYEDSIPNDIIVGMYDIFVAELF